VPIRFCSEAVNFRFLFLDAPVEEFALDRRQRRLQQRSVATDILSMHKNSDSVFVGHGWTPNQMALQIGLRCLMG
jgi:hypothetical protein